MGLYNKVPYFPASLFFFFFCSSVTTAAAELDQALPLVSSRDFLQLRSQWSTTGDRLHDRYSTVVL